MGEEPPILASDAEREESLVLLRDAVTSGGPGGTLYVRSPDRAGELSRR